MKKQLAKNIEGERSYKREDNCHEYKGKNVT
jgi:hypothetical protein